MIRSSRPLTCENHAEQGFETVSTQEKPYSPRTTASVDSQSVDASSGGEERGRDNAKNANGRKRHIVVDGMGLLLAALVTGANVDDAAAATKLFPRLENQPISQVRHIYADNQYHNDKLYDWVKEHAAWTLEIIRRPAGSVGWVTLPIRWTAERTFAWFSKFRRLSMDREKSIPSSEAFVTLSMIRLMLNRLAPAKDQAEPPFRYRKTC